MASTRGDGRRPGTASKRASARHARHGSQGRPRARDLVRRPATAQRHRLTFTSRSAVLGLALCAAVLTLAYPTKQYLAQRSANAAAAVKARQLQQQIDQLTAQHQQATDPTVVEQQARERLHYTLPGQRNYIQLSPPAAPAKPAPKVGNAALPTDDGDTWFGALWSSDQTAGS